MATYSAATSVTAVTTPTVVDVVTLNLGADINMIEVIGDESVAPFWFTYGAPGEVVDPTVGGLDAHKCPAGGARSIPDRRIAGGHQIEVRIVSNGSARYTIEVI